jgi:hypothetical protein
MVWDIIQEIIGELEFAEIPRLSKEILLLRKPNDRRGADYTILTEDDMSNSVMVCEFNKDWTIFALRNLAGNIGVVTIRSNGHNSITACRHGTSRYKGGYTECSLCPFDLDIDKSIMTMKCCREYIMPDNNVDDVFQPFVNYLRKINRNRVKRMMTWMTKEHVKCCRPNSDDGERHHHTLFYYLEPHSVLSIVSEFI